MIIYCIFKFADKETIVNEYGTPVLKDTGAYFPNSIQSPNFIEHSELIRRMNYLGMTLIPAKEQIKYNTPNLTKGEPGHVSGGFVSIHEWSAMKFKESFRDIRKQNQTLSSLLYQSEFIIPEDYVSERYLLKGEIFQEVEQKVRKNPYELRNGDILATEEGNFPIEMIDYDENGVVIGLRKNNDIEIYEPSNQNDFFVIENVEIPI